MKRLLIALLIIAILQLACGVVPSVTLWGMYYTPTPMQTTDAPVVLDPTMTPFPTASPTSTLTPTITPTAITSFITPTRAGPTLSNVIQPSITPTFNAAPILYYTQSGDTVPSLARRFNLAVSEVMASSSSLPPKELIDPGTLLVLPNRIKQKTTPNIQIMPDSEVVFTATAVGFDIGAYINKTNGYLKTYREYLGSTGWVDGAEAIRRLAYENSINPRLLLALLEYESRWVSGQPVDQLHADYPMGYENFRYKSMFTQMVWAINQMSIAYYGWRTGTITELNFPDGTSLRIDPRLNAGTVAIQYLFAQLHSQSQWAQIIDPKNGFPALYTEMFGDPWARAGLVNPILPPGLQQPTLVLPFQSKVEWSFTGGPHGAWEHDGSQAALDFAPSTDHGGCAQTPTWVTAMSPGLVVRSENGVVVVDMDGDGYEQTGWVIVYLHIATVDRDQLGEWVNTNDHIGHASCEGGIATGTHVHIVRKYNGEWIAADGPAPFVMSGWTTVAGTKPYEGRLVRGAQTIVADPVGQAWSVIFRDPDATPTPTSP